MKILDEFNELIKCKYCGGDELRLVEKALMCTNPVCGLLVKRAEENELKQVEQIMADNAAKIKSYPLEEEVRIDKQRVESDREIMEEEVRIDKQRVESDREIMFKILEQLREINASCKRLVEMHK